MPNIRAKFPLRVAFLALNITIVFLTFQIVRGEDKREWKQYQREFKVLRESALQAKLDHADRAVSTRESENLRRSLDVLRKSDVEFKQIFLVEPQRRDLCVTCHMGIEDPLFQDAAQPFRTHPGDFLKTHKVAEFGCTLCHQGLGVGATVQAAHGAKAHGGLPILPAKYLQSACAQCHESSFMLQGAGKLETGRKLFIRRGCYACHGGDGFEDVPMMAGPLDAIATKLSNASWLGHWLTQPTRLREHTLMPNFRLSPKEVGDLTAYLWSPKPEKGDGAASLRNASADTGRKLFVERGCRGCHSVEQGTRSASDRIPNLAGVGLKVRPEWMLAWLEDPKAYNENTLMPKVDLTDAERVDLAAYLMTLTANSDVVKPREDLGLDERDADNGKKLFQVYGCYGCHNMTGFEALQMPGVAAALVGHKGVDELPFGQANVVRTKWDWIYNKIKSPPIYETADMPLRMPTPRLDDDEIEALTTYYLNSLRHDFPQRLRYASQPRVRALQQGEDLVARYACHGCHMLSDDQEPTIAEHLQRKSMVPPRLVGEGEKVQPQWLFQFLRKPSPLRPWLSITMPDFGFSHVEAETLVEYFAELSAKSGITHPYFTLPQKADMTQEEFEMGAYRINADKCAQCHPASLDGVPQGANTDDLSIDLMFAKSRLRFDWVKNFLRNPDRYAGAGTKMPFVFYSPDGQPRIPDAEMWIDLTAKHLMLMDELPAFAPASLQELRPGSQVDWTSIE